MLSEQYLINLDKKMKKYNRNLEKYDLLRTKDTKNIKGILYNVFFFSVYVFFIYYFVSLILNTNFDLISAEYIESLNVVGFFIIVSPVIYIIYKLFLEAFFGYRKYMIPDGHISKYLNYNAIGSVLCMSLLAILFGFFNAFLENNIDNSLDKATTLLSKDMIYLIKCFFYFGLINYSILLFDFFIRTFPQYLNIKKNRNERYTNIMMKMDKFDKKAKAIILSEIKDFNDYQILNVYCERNNLSIINNEYHEELKKHLLKIYNTDNFNELEDRFILNKNKNVILNNY